MAVDGQRGQLQTLEGVVAGLLVLASLTFALQTTAVTPLSVSTASQHIENQQYSMAEGILATADKRGVLKTALLYWDEDNGQFHGASDVHYIGDPPTPQSGHPTPQTDFFGMLENRFGQEGVAYNVYAVYRTSTGRTVRQRVVYVGQPSDNAVVASRRVALYVGDRLYEADGSLDSTAPVTLEGASYFAPKVSPSGNGLYNVVTVEVVVWRI